MSVCTRGRGFSSERLVSIDRRGCRLIDGQLYDHSVNAFADDMINRRSANVSEGIYDVRL